ncbi:MAG: tyrosine-type recombinase/integrase [Bacteroidales bacterium]|jgi:integrase
MGENLYPFRKATLNDCGGDVSQRWYISFYAWSIQKNMLIRRRDYSVNNYKTKEERRAYAKNQIKSINVILSDGYHIDVNKKSEKETEINKSVTLEKALLNILEIKKSTFRNSSYLSFSSTLNIFLKWAKDNKFAFTNINYFDRFKAQMYVDYLLSEKKFSGKTVNVKNSCLKSLFNNLIERDVIKENPFVKLKKQKEVKSLQNIAYTTKEIEKIKKEILKTDKELWLFIQFIYYCFMRPNEIRLLKIENIDLKKRKIFIPAAISKNCKEGYLDIPAPLFDSLKISKILKGKNNYYLFCGKTQEIPVSKNVMSRRHRIIIDELGFGSNYTLYSWKHTGVVQAYNAGVDIKSIQRQCRHSSIEMTDNYLKSLGLYENEAFLMKMPKL